MAVTFLLKLMCDVTHLKSFGLGLAYFNKIHKNIVYILENRFIFLYLWLYNILCVMFSLYILVYIYPSLFTYIFFHILFLFYWFISLFCNIKSIKLYHAYIYCYKKKVYRQEYKLYAYVLH